MHFQVYHLICQLNDHLMFILAQNSKHVLFQWKKIERATHTGGGKAIGGRLLGARV